MEQIIDISGVWEFQMDTDKAGLEAHYEKVGFSDSITLPGTTSEAKKGAISSERATGHLTDPYRYEGYAWYRKTVELPKADSYILHLERTRISYVWMNGKYVGSYDSFIAPHQYDLTPYATLGQNTLTLMISNVDYVTSGGHMTSDDTQTNWNGILGGMTITCHEKARIAGLKTSCDYAQSTAVMKLDLMNLSEQVLPARIIVETALLQVRNSNSKIPGTSIQILRQDNCLPDLIRECSLSSGDNTILLRHNLSACLHTWDEWEPAVYEFTLILADAAGTELDRRITHFGLKDFVADGLHFAINGIPTFLRGKHDGMIFPLTGYAPMNLSEWLRVLSIAKDYGINHYRFHTCCPPEAAFLAADLLGLYLQPELSFWGTFKGPEDEDYDERMQGFLREEGFRMLEAFANHPSYCMMSMGNELWGNDKALDNLLAEYKAVRPEVLYTQGSNNFFWTPKIGAHDDFFSGVRFSIDRQLRGSFAACDVPYGHIQTAEPATLFNYDDSILPPYARTGREAGCEGYAAKNGDFSDMSSADNSSPAGSSVSADLASRTDEGGMIEIQYGTGVKKVKASELGEELIPHIPVISHEVGQYEFYPDYREIAEYTGVLKPYNLVIFKERLEVAGLADYAEAYFVNSGFFAIELYKDEIETMLRSAYMGGFQLLDLQDYTGQGTALVGILNSLYQNKGLITAKEWQGFCSDCVVQAEFASYLVAAGDEFSFSVGLRYQRKALPETTLTCKITLAEIDTHKPSRMFQEDRNVKVVAEQTKAFSVGRYGYQIVSQASVRIPETDVPKAYRLALSIPELDTENSYELWTYPKEILTDTLAVLPSGTAVAYTLSDALKQAEKCHKVLLFLSEAENPNSIEGFYATDFWNYGMFRSIAESIGKKTAPGTMGLLIDKNHPALSDFPCESYTTPQWFAIVQHSSSTILDGSGIRPIVQTIDNVERNHLLGMIYEIYLKDLDCNLVVCTSDLPVLCGLRNTESDCKSVNTALPALSDSSAIDSRKEAKQLLASLLKYLNMSSPSETVSLTSEEFIRLIG